VEDYIIFSLKEMHAVVMNGKKVTMP